MSGLKTIFVNGYKAQTLSLQVPDMQTTSVQHLKTLMIEKHGELDDFRMWFAGKELREKSDDGEDLMLSDYNIQNNSTLQVVIRLPGGMSDTVRHNTTTGKKEYGVSDSTMTFVDDADAITGDYDPETKRAKMSCGHAVEPNSLTAWCRSLIDKGFVKLKCPALIGTGRTNCDKEWPYFEVRKLALLNEEEMKFFESKLSEMAAQMVNDMKECPGCRSFVERKCSTNLRVVCVVCRASGNAKYEFCWNCSKPWSGPTTSSVACGSPTCQHPELPLVRDCDETITKCGISGVPKRRACPTCGCVLEHTPEGCKFLVCRRCQKEFCFVCLKLKADCLKDSSYYDPCSSGVAPKQTKIPIWSR